MVNIQMVPMKKGNVPPTYQYLKKKKKIDLVTDRHLIQ